VRLGIIIITALIISLFSPFSASAEEEKAKSAPKPTLVVTAERIARGKTFTDKNSENVSFTLRPIRAFLKISF